MADTALLRIRSAAYEKSKKGHNMIHLLLQGNDGDDKLFIHHYITFMPHNRDMTNRLLNAFFEGFGIEKGNFCFEEWVGKEAEAVLEDNEWNGKVYKKVKYFKKKQEAEAAVIEKIPEATGEAVKVDGILKEQQEDLGIEYLDEMEDLEEKKKPLGPVDDFNIEDFEKEFG